jgi:hypothetical protein
MVKGRLLDMDPEAAIAGEQKELSGAQPLTMALDVLPTQRVPWPTSHGALPARTPVVAGARPNGRGRYTLAMITRFKLSTLRSYEARLRSDPACSIAWESVPRSGKIDQPNREEFLQLGDLAASAIGKAFELDSFGNTERRYLQELVARLYRRGSSATPLTSYGLKMHPWNAGCQTAHPWVATL